MRIKLTEVGISGDDGEHYEFATDLDVANEDEAYVKGREFQKLAWALGRGLAQQEDEIMAEGNDE